MSSVEQLELLQQTLDRHFDGQLDEFTLALETLAEANEKLGFYQTAGNQNLIFYSNTPMLRYAERHPDTLRGTIIGDFDPRISSGHPTIERSYLYGPTYIFGESTIRDSNVSYATIHHSVLEHTLIAGSLTKMYQSRAKLSHIASSTLVEASVNRCYLGNNSGIGNEELEDQLILDGELRAFDGFNWQPQENIFPRRG